MEGINKNKEKYPISQNVEVDVNVMENLLDVLEKGQNSTQMIRNIILQHYSIVKLENSSYNTKIDYLNALDHHSRIALHTYATSISMLQNRDFDVGFVEKRKLNDPCNSDEASENQESPKSYKRRKVNGESLEKEVTSVIDDGFAWRKYGQKMIHGYHHPRQYFRCTHKYEQKCQATKQIQQISENPTKYKLIYYNNHTCNNNKTSPYMINSPDEPSSSAIIWSFDGSNPINPSLFSTDSTFHTSFGSDAKGVLNHMKITKLKTSEVSSSSNTISEQSDEHTSTEVVDVENYNDSSTSTSITNLLEEDYTNFMDEFSQVFPDWWTTL